MSQEQQTARDYGTEVKLLAYTMLMGEDYSDHPTLLGGEHLIEHAGRLCYNMIDKLGTNPNWIQSRIQEGHESILEHASMTFYIKASRVLTHELVRHRIASYSQRSQRYVKESEAKYITPPELAESDTFSGAILHCWLAYGKLLDMGIKPEIARYVLPNACETQIIMTMNFRELRHFIKLRTSKRALPEMQEVANKVKDICKQYAPKVFEDI